MTIAMRVANSENTVLWTTLPLPVNELKERMKLVGGVNNCVITEFLVDDSSTIYRECRVNESENVFRLNNAAKRIKNFSKGQLDCFYELPSEYDVIKLVELAEAGCYYDKCKNLTDLAKTFINEYGGLVKFFKLTELQQTQIEPYFSYEAFGKHLNNLSDYKFIKGKHGYIGVPTWVLDRLSIPHC